MRIKVKKCSLIVEIHTQPKPLRACNCYW